MYEWNFISCFLDFIRGNSLVMMYTDDTLEFFYVELCECDSLNFYTYMVYGVLFGGPHFLQLYIIINYSALILIIELCN